MQSCRYLYIYIYIYIYRQGLSVYPLKSVGPESFQKGVQAAREGHAGPTARSRAQAPQCPVNSDANRSVQLARFAAVTIYIYIHMYIVCVSNFGECFLRIWLTRFLRACMRCMHAYLFKKKLTAYMNNALHEGARMQRAHACARTLIHYMDL
jgi:hypothetical protein